MYNFTRGVYNVSYNSILHSINSRGWLESLPLVAKNYFSKISFVQTTYRLIEHKFLCIKTFL